MPSIFSRIIAGEIPAFKVAESEQFLAFLDIHPLERGHTLVIPKLEVDYLFDMEDDLLGEMMVFAKKVARKQKKVISCQRIGIAVIGLEVPHAHIHLVPINKVGDIDFSKPKMHLEEDEMRRLADAIRIA